MLFPSSGLNAQEPIHSITRALVDAFGARFEVWARTDDCDHWECVTDEGTRGSSDSVRQALDEFANRNDSGNPTPYLAADDGNPSVLVVPLTALGHPDSVALASFLHASPILPRMAKLFLREYQQRIRIRGLAEENDAIVGQLNNYFEEMMFLRQIAEHLELADPDFDMRRMAELTLPLLVPLIQGRELVLVSSISHIERNGTAWYSADAPVIRIGERQLCDADCVRLVEMFRAAAETRPVVKNTFHRSAEAAHFPQLREFILVPIAKSKAVMGWILALNRERAPGINPDDLPWGLSQLEFGTHEASLISSTASILATHGCNVALIREKEMLVTSSIRALVSAIEAKDHYTLGHSERVAIFARRLAQELGLSSLFCEQIYLTGLLHDVGKIGVSDAVLKKPEALTPQEFEEIQLHPDKGWSILSELQPLRYVLPGVLHHHERIDGSGYPDGLAGEAIPLEGRILAVADAYDALTSDRSYRSGKSQAEAEQVLRDGAGTQWDARFVETFLRIMPEIIAIRQNYQVRPWPTRARSRTTS